MIRKEKCIQKGEMHREKWRQEKGIYKRGGRRTLFQEGNAYCTNTDRKEQEGDRHSKRRNIFSKNNNVRKTFRKQEDRDRRKEKNVEKGGGRKKAFRKEEERERRKEKYSQKKRGSV